MFLTITVPASLFIFCHFHYVLKILKIEMNRVLQTRKGSSIENKTALRSIIADLLSRCFLHQYCTYKTLYHCLYKAKSLNTGA